MRYGTCPEGVSRDDWLDYLARHAINDMDARCNQSAKKAPLSEFQAGLVSEHQPAAFVALAARTAREAALRAVPREESDE